MRNLSDIKFKFWLPNKKEMVGPFNLWSIYMNGDEDYGNRFALDHDYYVSHLPEVKGGCFEIDPNNLNIPLQFIGLHDCEGKEIYEGDIVEIELYKIKYKKIIEYKDGYLGCIIPNTETFGSDHPLNSFSNTKIKILGNIYENPELLENKS